MNKNELLSATSLCCNFDNVELITVDGINILGLSNINESEKDHYIVYRILNHVNGRYYIGQHHTCKPLDNYMGSGNLIKLAIQKYTISCFSKEILYDFSTFEEMNQKEKELVPLSSCYPTNPLSYNLIEGGHSPILSGIHNGMYGKKLKNIMGEKRFNEMRKKQIKARKQRIITLETCNKISKANAGKNNGMYGKRGNLAPHYNKIAVINKKTKHCLYIKKCQLEKYFNMGYVLGNKNKGCKRTKLQKQNNRLAHVGRKLMYNQTINDYKQPLPKDFEYYIKLGYKFTKP